MSCEEQLQIFGLVWFGEKDTELTVFYSFLSRGKGEGGLSFSAWDSVTTCGSG